MLWFGRLAAAAAAAVALALAAAQPAAAGVPEEARVRQFYSKWGGEWPLDSPYNFRDPRELARREEELMRNDNPEDRLTEWRTTSQEQFLPNMTQKGFQVDEIPKTLYHKLYRFVHDNIERATSEGVRDKKSAAITSKATYPALLNLDFERELRREVIETLQPIHERWCNCKLKFNALYGVRIYFDETVLGCHLDRKETHVVSSILHIADDVLEPWPLLIRDFFGRWTAVNLEPGEMLHYEGAKMRHCRPTILRGAWYANAFLHFSPVSWNISADDAMAAVPPHWSYRLPHRAQNLEILNGTVPGSPEREEMVVRTMRAQRDRRGWPKLPILDPTRADDEAHAARRQAAQAEALARTTRSAPRRLTLEGGGEASVSRGLRLTTWPRLVLGLGLLFAGVGVLLGTARSAFCGDAPPQGGYARGEGKAL